MENSKRRWAEIRFYYFSKEIYEINKELLDIATIIEAVALLTPHSKPERLKGLSAKLLSDISAIPNLVEVVFLMHQFNYSNKTISETVGKTTRTISRIITQREKPPFLPILQKSDDELIMNFLITLDKIQKAGILNESN